MELFLDTANQQEIEQAVAMGVIAGVTTNPSLIAKETGDYLQQVAYYCDLVKGPVSVEVLAVDAEGMLAEARQLASIHENIVVKLPITMASLAVIKQLASEGIKTNGTLVFSANQGLLLARAGATYVSPFVGRINDIGQDGLTVVEELATIFRVHSLPTKIIAASIRSPRQVTEAALLGAHVVTLPYKILQQMVQHPQTDLGIAIFEDDWQKRK